MINHARTLLANIDGARASRGTPGEELIPPAFRQLRLPRSVQAVRRVLFGVDPDREYMNYRLRELMTLLHSTELEEFVLALDPRVTYWPIEDAELFVDGFGVTTTRLHGTEADRIYVTGQPAADDQNGRMVMQWRLEVMPDEQVNVRRTTRPSDADTTAYEVQAGLSTPTPLSGSGLTVRFAAVSGAAWMIRSQARPATELGQLTEHLRSVVDELLAIDLFGAAPRGEPQQTFWNLWTRHPHMPYQLGGLLLGTIYRINEMLGGARGG